MNYKIVMKIILEFDSFKALNLGSVWKVWVGNL